MSELSKQRCPDCNQYGCVCEKPEDSAKIAEALERPWDEVVAEREAAIEAERKRLWREETAARIMAALAHEDSGWHYKAACAVLATDALRLELDKPQPEPQQGSRPDATEA